MSIPSDTCALCCTCPTVTVEWDSRSASRGIGYYGDGTGDGYYLNYVTTYVFDSSDYNEDGTAANGCSGPLTADSSVSSGSVEVTCSRPNGYEECTGETGSITIDNWAASYGGTCGPTTCGFGLEITTTITYAPTNGSGTLTQIRDDVWADCTGLPNYGPVETIIEDYLWADFGYSPSSSSVSYTGFQLDSLIESNLETRTFDALPAYNDNFIDTAGSYRNKEIVTGGRTLSIRESRYRLRFKIPTVGTALNFRAVWVERFIAEAGVSISSVSVNKSGVYRPTVTLSAPPSGGTQAYAVAVMSSTGTVSSISLLEPGLAYIPLITFSGGGGTGAAGIAIINSSGAVTGVNIISGGSSYTSAPTVAFTDVIAPRVRATGTATILGGVVTGINIGTAGDFRPTVTVQAATGGGTSSTGWVATLNPSTGQVSTIASGSAGDYRPTLAFTGGGGSSATATCTLDATGGIDAVTVTVGGSAYTSEPSLTITAKVTGSTAADLLIHLGTETTKCAVWDGTKPGGYDPATSSTWPILPSAAPNYYSLAVPGTDGTTLVANVRTFCDGSTC